MKDSIILLIPIQVLPKSQFGKLYLPYALMITRLIVCLRRQVMSIFIMLHLFICCNTNIQDPWKWIGMSCSFDKNSSAFLCVWFNFSSYQQIHVYVLLPTRLVIFYFYFPFCHFGFSKDGKIDIELTLENPETALQQTVIY